MFLYEKTSCKNDEKTLNEDKKRLHFFRKRSYCFTGSFINKNFTEIYTDSACRFFKMQKRISVFFI